jgi:hypothetical protein
MSLLAIMLLVVAIILIWLATSVFFFMFEDYLPKKYKILLSFVPSRLLCRKMIKLLCVVVMFFVSIFVLFPWYIITGANYSKNFCSWLKKTYEDYFDSRMII